MTWEEFLELSDERDCWHKLLVTAQREAFDRGRATGRREGYSRGRADETRDWMDALRPARAQIAARGPAHAELDLKRWGPGGRQHFADPRQGDYPGRGRATEAAA
ncbi:MAG: hypothetical protein ACRDOU_05440 [Streptosporangiaceae bacterium]